MYKYAEVTDILEELKRLRSSRWRWAIESVKTRTSAVVFRRMRGLAASIEYAGASYSTLRRKIKGKKHIAVDNSSALMGATVDALLEGYDGVKVEIKKGHANA